MTNEGWPPSIRHSAFAIPPRDCSIFPLAAALFALHAEAMRIVVF
jgi:hypothetical protein